MDDLVYLRRLLVATELRLRRMEYKARMERRGVRVASRRSRRSRKPVGPGPGLVPWRLPANAARPDADAQSAAEEARLARDLDAGVRQEEDDGGAAAAETLAAEGAQWVHARVSRAASARKSRHSRRGTARSRGRTSRAGTPTVRFAPVEREDEDEGEEASRRAPTSRSGSRRRGARASLAVKAVRAASRRIRHERSTPVDRRRESPSNGPAWLPTPPPLLKGPERDIALRRRRMFEPPQGWFAGGRAGAGEGAGMAAGQALGMAAASYAAGARGSGNDPASAVRTGVRNLRKTAQPSPSPSPVPSPSPPMERQSSAEFVAASLGAAARRRESLRAMLRHVPGGASPVPSLDEVGWEQDRSVPATPPSRTASRVGSVHSSRAEANLARQRALEEAARRLQEEAGAEAAEAAEARLRRPSPFVPLAPAQRGEPGAAVGIESWVNDVLGRGGSVSGYLEHDSPAAVVEAGGAHAAYPLADAWTKARSRARLQLVPAQAHTQGQPPRQGQVQSQAGGSPPRTSLPSSSSPRPGLRHANASLREARARARARGPRRRPRASAALAISASASAPNLQAQPASPPGSGEEEEGEDGSGGSAPPSAGEDARADGPDGAAGERGDVLLDPHSVEALRFSACFAPAPPRGERGARLDPLSPPRSRTGRASPLALPASPAARAISPHSPLSPTRQRLGDADSPRRRGSKQRGSERASSRSRRHAGASARDGPGREEATSILRGVARLDFESQHAVREAEMRALATDDAAACMVSRQAFVRVMEFAYGVRKQTALRLFSAWSQPATRAQDRRWRSLTHRSRFRLVAPGRKRRPTTRAGSRRSSRGRSRDRRPGEDDFGVWEQADDAPSDLDWGGQQADAQPMQRQRHMEAVLASMPSDDSGLARLDARRFLAAVRCLRCRHRGVASAPAQDQTGAEPDDARMPHVMDGARETVFPPSVPPSRPL